jgi:hypothetical protein
LADGSNNGLAAPIAALVPVVAQYENKAAGVSRADIWALAAMVGAAVAKNGGAKVNFTQNWFGRLNCEDANSVCLNATGAVVACSATAGPFRSLPPPDMDTNGTFSFFAQNFGFDEKQTVALMGAHTVGRAMRNVSFYGRHNMLPPRQNILTSNVIFLLPQGIGYQRTQRMDSEQHGLAK